MKHERAVLILVGVLILGLLNVGLILRFPESHQSSGAGVDSSTGATAESEGGTVNPRSSGPGTDSETGATPAAGEAGQPAPGADTVTGATGTVSQSPSGTPTTDTVTSPTPSAEPAPSPSPSPAPPPDTTTGPTPPTPPSPSPAPPPDTNTGPTPAPSPAPVPGEDEEEEPAEREEDTVSMLLDAAKVALLPVVGSEELERLRMARLLAHLLGRDFSPVSMSISRAAAD
ncbi:MAG: hypothetical protein KKF41_08835 [Actinobacteria bacterium]|nr:hypothetical protein [Actinomycetota bacterium]MBU1943856.1 hypothetical protein [Actinomycetota bacterium]MBU2687677.1 hypothetical protein [Actinomycetota bacterium]